MLIFKRAVVLVLLLPFLFFGLFMLDRVPLDYLDVAVNILFAYVAFLVVAFIVTILVGWLEYYRYSISISEKNLNVARGLIATEQIGIPYRRIQDIRIKRSMVEQIFGVSEVVISIVGSDGDDSTQHDTIILPALAKEVALEIHANILKRAQVEQISMQGGSVPPR